MIPSRVCRGKGFPLAGTGHSVKLRIYFAGIVYLHCGISEISFIT